MENTLTKFKTWFEKRDLREKLLVSGLSWAIIYALFALILFRPLDIESTELAVNIKKANDDIASWQTQLKFLKDIPNTAIYKEWVASHKSYQALKDKYKDLLGKPVEEKWDEIIKSVLSNYPNIKIERIQNAPEVLFQGNPALGNTDSIYQQQAQVVALGNFPDILGYLSYLEGAVPNINWDSFSYKVIEYPQARVEMEFSVLYEKSKPAP